MRIIEATLLWMFQQNITLLLTAILVVLTMLVLLPVWIFGRWPDEGRHAGGWYYYK